MLTLKDMVGMGSEISFVNSEIFTNFVSFEAYSAKSKHLANTAKSVWAQRTLNYFRILSCRLGGTLACPPFLSDWDKWLSNSFWSWIFKRVLRSTWCSWCHVLNLETVKLMTCTWSFYVQLMFQIVKHLSRIGKTPFLWDGFTFQKHDCVLLSVVCHMQHAWYLPSDYPFFLSLFFWQKSKKRKINWPKMEKMSQRARVRISFGFPLSKKKAWTY